MNGFSKKLEDMVAKKLREQDEKIDAMQFDVNSVKDSIKKLEDLKLYSSRGQAR